MLIEDETIRKITEGILDILQNKNEISIECDLMNQGLDSLKTVQLIVWLEEVFDIVIDDEDLLFENFESISKISSLVKKYRAN
ncbi:phosphopantetheine-binding protein [Paenibacillus camerounensis]|uniref:phosphopantetheine-binding protein n=1 Tax=Paenibacillus camerounensis TaxID=1243663 RepID=UPI0006941DD1|nr:phosphopantetheine-binding protein [Paenibacillus camerounensis]